MAGSSRPPLVIRCEKMRIAWVLSISRIRKAGKSLTAPGGPGSPGVDLAGRGWARPSSRGPTWPLSCLGCAIADDLYSRQRRATRNGCEMRQEAPRLRVWRENATQVAMAQLLYCHVVASILVAWPIQGNSHNHLCIKNSCQKQIFKKAEIFSLLCRETAAVEFSLLCRQNRGAAFRCSFRCLHRKRAVGRRARRTGSFIRETVFAPTNNPNMEETGSLENPIPSGECNLGLNRAEKRSSVQTLLYARHAVTSGRPATLSPPGTTTG